MSKYEKPALKFVSLRPKENVADPCWSPSVNSDGTIWYYDPNEGDRGYFSFQVIPVAGKKGNQCGQVKIVIKEKFNYDDPKTEQIEPAPSDTELIALMTNAAGGNSGQPFKTGAGIQDNPGGMS